MSLHPARFRYSSLLVAILALLVLHPYFGHGPVQRTLQTAFFSFVMIAAVFAVSRTRRQATVGFVLGIPHFVLLWIANLVEGGPWGPLAGATGIAFFSFASVVLLRSVLRSERITQDTIYGSLCTYLLLGVTWAYAYSFLETVVPGSFGGGQEGRSIDFLYFSYVTLTTLGYGDVLPITQKAKSLAMLEAVTGVIFVAVQIARVVGMHQAARED
jgi:hypothetical protein